MEPGFQKYAWANGVGDDWLERNRGTLGERDVASEAIEMIGLKPEKVLEVGCANGWRLKKLQEKYECHVHGVDVSERSIDEAQAANLDCVLASADKLPYPDNSFDMVIYGYCLCFISPEDWLKIVGECDRVLQDGGYVLVYDFICTAYVKRRILKMMLDPKLEEKPVYLFNYDWPKLWTGHPAYRVKTNVFNLPHGECCTVLEKDYKDLLFDLDEDGARIP